MKKNSEIITNKDASVYHLSLLPDQIAKTIFLVGDQDRVDRVSKHFDSIEYKVQKREFRCHTGYYNGHRMSALSTGIGTDNIDIVLNELNLLFNYNFVENTWYEDRKKAYLIRLGTSGAIQEDIPVDSLVCSSHGMGLDGMAFFYNRELSEYEDKQSKDLNHFVTEHFGEDFAKVYFASSSKDLLSIFKNELTCGITCSANGFYAPQGRNVDSRSAKYPGFVDELAQFRGQGERITNLEMETSGIYSLSKVFGFEALSVNAILANRKRQEFSSNASETVEGMIEYCLNKISQFLD